MYTIKNKPSLLGILLIFAIVLNIFSNNLGLIILIDNYCVYYLSIISRIGFYKMLLIFPLWLISKKSKKWYNYLYFSITDIILIGFSTYSSYAIIIPLFTNIDISSINTTVPYLKSLSNGCLKFTKSMPVIRIILNLFYSTHHYLSYIPLTKKGFFIKQDILYVLSSFKHRRTFTLWLV